MASDILLKRGLNTSFSPITLKSGEPAFITDTGKLYIGDGIKKILINPIDKPSGINVTNFYAKVKVNEYGQVVNQNNLLAADIPIIPNTRVSGLGTASTTNVGTNAGNIPILDTTAKLSESIMPLSVIGSGAMAYYNGTSAVIVSSNQYVPLTGFFSTSANYTLDSNGVISINQTGIYLISYTLSSNSLELNTMLGPGPGNYNGWIGTNARSTTTSVTPYTSTSATIMKQVTTVPEKYGIKNSGTLGISLVSGCGNISIFKIG